MKKRFEGIIFALIALIVAPPAWSQSELVLGRFDSVNDWFVFEWDHPESGKRHSILDPASKIKPKIEAVVTTDATSNGYIFNYKVTNLSGARQPLQKFYVNHPADVFNPKSPSAEWLSSEYRNERLWHWAKVLGTTTGIPAGQTVGGFSFKSKGLPSIVNAEFSGTRRQEYSMPEDDDPDGVHDSFSRVYENLKARYPDKFVNIVKQKTLGPIDPPKEFVAGDFIQNLLSLHEQSYALGWIKEKGVANSLTVKLNAAKKKILSGDKKTAKNILTGFLNELQAQNGKQVSAEAYALLYFNGMYLMDHL